MVASHVISEEPALGGVVSIPFIAGQWSLPATGPAKLSCSRRFQSPSLRGSGRFEMIKLAAGWDGSVSIPFIAGQWSLPGFGPPPAAGGGLVSIPFIAGQWSLPELERGMGDVDARQLFQSPSLRGSGRFGRPARWERSAAAVSIPFIAGQWSLHRSAARR